MGIANKLTALCAILPLLAAAPASADTASRAEKLRRLDIMLMVTSLRCRTTADNFQVDYARFTGKHLGSLNAAAEDLRRELHYRYGRIDADRALDKISVGMANTYGQGHPWLSCQQLKQVARGLADVDGTVALAEAADQLLSPVSGGQLAFARK